jgi:hypothetical protein
VVDVATDIGPSTISHAGGGGGCGGGVGADGDGVGANTLPRTLNTCPLGPTTFARTANDAVFGLVKIDPAFNAILAETATEDDTGMPPGKNPIGRCGVGVGVTIGGNVGVGLFCEEVAQNSYAVDPSGIN